MPMVNIEVIKDVFTPAQKRELIEKVITEHRLNTGDVDGLAQQRFGVGLAQLNKLQASGLIDELLDTYASRPRGGRRA